MNYPDSVSYLYALGNELKVGAKFGLERIRILLAAMGNPERGQRFVHVAGTNGKGSTCAMLSSILQHSGYSTGLYTSPHLIEPTERIQIDGQPLTHEAFRDAFLAVHRTAEELIERGEIDAHPSYFETVTAMAFLVFREKCEISVIEVGLGGRLDATNVITPELCIVTPVSFDHENFLGNTLEAITGEKAGILKSGVPVVIGKQEPIATRILTERATALECEIIEAGHASPESVHVTARSSTFVLEGTTYTCPLPGRHQIQNAIMGILSARRLGVSTAAIQAGLARAAWPGRLEFVSSAPDMVLDGAHNPAGAAALASYIREFCSGRLVWMIYGAMRDKAIDEVTGQLFPLAQKLVLTAPNMPRALRPEIILQIAPHPNTTVTETVTEALHVASMAPPETIVFITGSLFLVGEARALLSPPVEQSLA
jgi:dihydrofolate synthase / folylpolyglutamate synthase